MVNALKESLFKITAAMTARKKVWEQNLSESNEEYKETYETYLTRYYAYLIA